MVQRGSILTRVARGDPHAVAACIDEYAPMVRALATRYLGASGADADDAVQDVFVELWRCADRFKPAQGSSEAAFVATIAHRRLIDAQRRRAARPTTVGDALVFDAHAATPPPTGRPSESQHAAAHAEDDLRLAHHTLGQLPDPVREAMYLSFFHGLTHSAIAQRTGVPIGTVKTRLRKGLVEVRRAILGEAAGPAPELPTSKQGGVA
jgi:RNA polymerase sigma-70 factor (ECF subfamily)